MPNRLFTITALCSLPLFASAVAQPPAKPDAAAAPAASQVKTLDQQTVLRLLQDEKPVEVRRAAESVQQSVPKDREQLLEVAEAVKSALSTTRDSDAEAALRLALGKLA